MQERENDKVERKIIWLVVKWNKINSRKQIFAAFL